MPTATINESQIREAAYHMWLNAGQPQGQEQDFWLQAEASLAARKGAKKPAAKKTAANKAAAPKAETKTAKAKTAKPKAKTAKKVSA